VEQGCRAGCGGWKLGFVVAKLSSRIHQRDCVSATLSDDSVASFSSYGNWLSVAAPGCNILTTFNNGSYAGDAAPRLRRGSFRRCSSGDVCKFGLSNAQVKSIIEQSADDLGAAGYDQYYGWAG